MLEGGGRILISRQSKIIFPLFFLFILLISFWLVDSLQGLDEIYKRLLISLLIVAFGFIVIRLLSKKHLEEKPEKSQLDFQTPAQKGPSSQQAEIDFKSIFENAVLGIYRTTPDGKVLAANPTLVKMLGYSSFEELKKRNLEKEGFGPTYNRKEFKERLEREGEIKGLEAAWIKKDGSLLYIRENARVIKDENGNVLYYEGTIEDITDKKYAEKALKESEEKYRFLFERSPAINLIIGIDEKIKDANENLTKWLGYAKDEVIGKSVLDFIVPEQKEKVSELLERSFQGMDIAENEIDVYAKDGSVHTLLFSRGQAILHENDKPISILVTGLDITKRKQMENALKESEERFKNLADLLPEMVFEVDTNGIITYANEKWFKFFGYTPQQIQGGFHGANTIIPEERNKALENMKAVLNGKDIGWSEYTAVKKDGSTAPIMVHSAPIVRGGKIVGARGVVIDMTERKATELALRESEKRYRSLFENASDAIFVESLSGDILEVNQKACELLGYTKDELLSLKVKDILPPGEEDRVYEIANRLDETPSLIIEGKNRRKDGTLIDVEVSIRLIEWKGEEAALVLVRDITERKKIEEAQRQRAERTLKFQQALLDLAKIEFEDWETALRTITELDAKTLGVERVGVWLFNSDRTEIICGDLFKLSERKHEIGARLEIKKYPRYFKAIEESRIIVADDVKEDARTNEFVDDYLAPHGITSMMDVPIRLHGQVAGIICHEHVGKKRSWTPEEQSFAISIADTVSLALEEVERERAIKALMESEEKYRAAVEQSADNIYIMDLETKNILEANPTLLKLLGYTNDEIKKLSVYDIVAHPPEEINSKIELVVRKKRAFIGERQYRCKDGSLVDVESSASYITYGGKKALCVVSRDITKRKKMEEELKRLAITDALTGVLNRMAGLTVLKKQLQWANWTGTKFCICYVDVNGLKEINDAYGHSEGDQALIKVCELLRKVMRDTDTICRLGGDEFLLVLPDFTIEQTIGFKEKLVQIISDFNATSKKPYALEISLGFAEYDPATKISPEQLLAIADKEMYLAKYIK